MSFFLCNGRLDKAGKPLQILLHFNFCILFCTQFKSPDFTFASQKWPQYCSTRLSRLVWLNYSAAEVVKAMCEIADT